MSNKANVRLPDINKPHDTQEDLDERSELKSGGSMSDYRADSVERMDHVNTRLKRELGVLISNMEN